MRGHLVAALLLLPGLVAAQALVPTNKEVALAPEVTLLNGNDDILPTGNCTAEIKSFCHEINPGEGRLANCISDRIAESEAQDSEAGTVSDECREEVYQFKILRNTNINMNVPLAKACKVDAEKYCNSTWFFGYTTGKVIGCLRDVKSRLSPGCKEMVAQVQADGAEDYRADANLHTACSADAAKLCADVKTGGGRVQACLRSKRHELHWECEEQLFRQEMENADDIRLTVRLFVNCLPDKKRFCKDIPPGAARVKDCLEAHRNLPEFTPACKEEVDGMIERRVQDFRLDSRLRTSCNDEIQTLCAFYGEDDYDLMSHEADSVIRCLQDWVEEVKNQTCKQQIRKYQELASESIRFDTPLASACYQDRQSFCANVPPGSARVIRCLMKMRDKLSTTCRAMLFDEEVRFSANIDFQYPMKHACKNELQQFCKDVPHGEARVIRCLQSNKHHKDFGKECMQEMRQYEQEASSDYRFNYRLSKACKSDISSLCAGVCKVEEGQVCGGSVLRCLTDKRDQLKSDACKAEVLYFEKMEVADYRNDVILAAACRADVESFCSHVEPGEGRMHDCLRKNRAKLSEECRREELLLEEMEAENLELKPGILRVCKDERLTFCKGVVPGGARMFRCLAEKLGDPDFGEACRSEVMNKLQRRQANWKLDPPLRKACKSAVREFCAAEDDQHQEKALVYKCLVRSYSDLDSACQKELGRALHMAFFVWQPGALLTSECDADVSQFCLADRPNMYKTPGAVGNCLQQLVDGSRRDEQAIAAGRAAARPARALSSECLDLAEIAQPPDYKKAFEESMTMVLLQSQLRAVEDATGLQMLNTDRYGNARGLTLTGWEAVAGMAALVVLCLWGAGYAWKKWTGHPSREYTLVVKKQYKH